MTSHYANISVQYIAIFHGCKNDNFQMKIFDIFLIFAQNIDCGYTLEPPQIKHGHLCNRLNSFQNMYFSNEIYTFFTSLDEISIIRTHLAYMYI